MRSNKRLKLGAIVLGIIILVVVMPLVLLVMVAPKIEIKQEAQEWADNTTINIDPVLTAADSMLFRLNEVRFDHYFYLETSDLRNDRRVLGVYGKDRKSLDAINNTGILFYTSIELSDDMSLDDVLIFQGKDTPPIENVQVAVMQTGIQQKSPVDSIICSYTADGDGLREFRHNDNFHSYNLNVKTLSIRYGEDESIDMAIPQDVKKTPRPMSFAFLKRGTKVYFIVYGRNVEKTDPVWALGDDFLGRIVKWEET